MELMNLLSILIAFVVVILLLSVVVTSMVQFALQLSGLRARNLIWGLSHILERRLIRMGSEPKLISSKNSAKSVASALVNSERFVDSLGRSTPGSQTSDGWLKVAFLWLRDRLSGVATRMTSPPLTWIPPEELKDRLQNLAALHPGGVGEPEQAVSRDDCETLLKDQDSILADFTRQEAYLSNRFIYQTRSITVACAFLVAFYFQLSTPELLRDLSLNPKLRESLLQQADAIVADNAMRLKTPTYSDAADEALTALANNRPNLSQALEEAAGIGADRKELIEEVDQIMADFPDERKQVVAEYGRLLDEIHTRNKQRDAKGESQQPHEAAMSRLAQFGFEPWRHGWSYYCEQSIRIDRLVGVLMTTVLLTFGAPFWFEMLKSLLKLRDMLKPGNDGNGAPTTQPEPQPAPQPAPQSQPPQSQPPQPQPTPQPTLQPTPQPTSQPEALPQPTLTAPPNPRPSARGRRKSQ